MSGRNVSPVKGNNSRPPTPPLGLSLAGVATRLASSRLSPPQSTSEGHGNNIVAPGTTTPPTVAPRSPRLSSNIISRMNSFGAADFAKLTELLEAPVAGVLSKWVNYGKGWQERVFVLEGGVLSYYKTHGPDRLSLMSEKVRRSDMRIIGEEARRLMKKEKGIVDERKLRQKPLGMLHLEVSTLRNSQSDDRKFYIYSGTKTVHLRADNEKERAQWMEALQTAKDNIDRRPAALTAVDSPVPNGFVSTDRLRVRLAEATVPDGVIRECEELVQQEVDTLQQTLKLEMHKSQLLLERLRMLEAEKVELETTVVDENERKHQKGGSESPSGSDDEKRGTEGGDTDDEGEQEVFFETEEFFGPGSRSMSAKSLLRTTSSNVSSPTWDDADRSDGLSDAEYGSACGSLGGTPRTPGRGLGSPSALTMDQVGFTWPTVKRRDRLPEPKQREKSVSLWSIIKDNVGKDLTRVCLPVYFNEPISSLQKCFEDLEYSYLLDRAYEYGRRGDSLMRMLHVAAFAVSGYSGTGENRTSKPFNPLLGETYEADFPDKGLRFFSEKVSHHPTILACHCESRGGWKFYGDANLKSKFWGRSIQLEPVGVLTLEFDDGEIFQWSKVTTSIYNLIIGKLYVDHYGTMKVQNNQDLVCRLKFKEQSIIDRNPHQVRGFVQNGKGEKLATLFGKWDDSMFYVLGDPAESASKVRGHDPYADAVCLWQKNPAAEYPTRYGLSSFAITMNELLPSIKEYLPPTDSRLRPDQKHLEKGEFDEANEEKLRLEQKQRRARKQQETGWQPRWFRKDGDTFRYTGGYWEAREKHDWTGCPDIFGIDPEDTVVDT